MAPPVDSLVCAVVRTRKKRCGFGEAHDNHCEEKTIWSIALEVEPEPDDPDKTPFHVVLPLCPGHIAVGVTATLEMLA